MIPLFVAMALWRYYTHKTVFLLWCRGPNDVVYQISWFSLWYVGNIIHSWKSAGAQAIWRKVFTFFYQSSTDLHVLDGQYKFSKTVNWFCLTYTIISNLVMNWNEFLKRYNRSKLRSTKFTYWKAQIQTKNPAEFLTLTRLSTDDYDYLWKFHLWCSM